MAAFFKSSTFVLWLLVAILGAWSIGFWFGLYFLMPWLDIPLHFLGGLWVYLFARALGIRFGLEINSQFKELAKLTFFMGAVLFVGVFWEFWEFILDRYIIHNGYSYFPGAYEDTLGDLVLDLLGGLTGYLMIKND